MVAKCKASRACKAPTCFRQKGKCRCPNPWIEFLHVNARRNPGASMTEHAVAYHQAMASGEFKLNPKLPNGRCKYDPYKLCAWLVRRRFGGKDFHAGILAAEKRRFKRAIREELRLARAKSRPSLTAKAGLQ